MHTIGQQVWTRQHMLLRDQRTGSMHGQYPIDTPGTVAEVYPRSHLGEYITVIMQDGRRVYANANWWTDESPGSRQLAEIERAAHDRDEIIHGGYR